MQPVIRISVRSLLALVLVAGISGAKAAETPLAPAAGWLDMTYPYDEKTVYWPTAEPFRLERASAGETAGGYWYASNNYSASEHGGTHVDAPRHFARGGRTIDQVPLGEWIAPAVAVDVRAACGKDPDYLLTVADLEAWEKRHGKIPAGAWLVMVSGWDGRFYPDRAKVLGTEKTGAAAVPELHFPGFSPEAVEWAITRRKIVGIAIDTPSVDRGQSTDFRAHRVFCAHNRLALENLANAEKLPPRGATLFVVPMLIGGGTGAPARVFARLPQQ